MRDGNRSNESDESLAARYRLDPTGDAGRAAASELFDRYWERVYLWCYRRIGHPETARDAAQDVLLSAYQALGTFEGRSRYSSWLFTIMRNRCFRVLRRASLVRDDEIEVDHLEDPGLRPDSDLIEEEDEEEVLALIRRVLEPLEQTALWLRAFDRLPVDEITRRLKLRTASGARGVIQNARRKLRSALEERAERRGKDRP
jgi:RNA polymerase sigma-70 factor (ECF subfamily)